jgi:hypothetical protein
MSNKMMSMLLMLLFTFLASFGLGELDIPCMAHAFLAERLSGHCQDLGR